jgi:hypothetical protein
MVQCSGGVEGPVASIAYASKVNAILEGELGDGGVADRLAQQGQRGAAQLGIDWNPESLSGQL